MAQHFLDRKEQGTVETFFDSGSQHVRCTITEWWEDLDSTTSECGSSAEYSVTRRVGLSRKDVHTLEGTLENSLGVPKLLELKASITAAVETEVGWEASTEEKKTFTFVSPKCGRQTNVVSQLVRQYQFVCTRLKGLFKQSRGWAATLTERLPYFDVRTDIEPWIEKCRCKEPRSEDYDGSCNLDMKRVSLGVPCRVQGSDLVFNLTGSTFSVPDFEMGGCNVRVPTALMPPSVLWLGELKGESVDAWLVPMLMPWIAEQSVRPASPLEEEEESGGFVTA